jgi:hypothetical protein
MAHSVALGRINKKVCFEKVTYNNKLHTHTADGTFLNNLVVNCEQGM